MSSLEEGNEGRGGAGGGDSSGRGGSGESGGIWIWSMLFPRREPCENLPNLKLRLCVDLFSSAA